VTAAEAVVGVFLLTTAVRTAVFLARKRAPEGHHDWYRFEVRARPPENSRWKMRCNRCKVVVWPRVAGMMPVRCDESRDFLVVLDVMES